MATQISYDHAKIEELVVYIAAKCENHRSFGAIKLNKILFAADFLSFRVRGTPITGETYRKFAMGPVPHHRLVFEKALLDSNAVMLRERDMVSGAYTEKRLIPLRIADLSGFAAAEIALVDLIITKFENMTAAEASEWSHQQPGWEFARENAEIPYFTALLPEEVGPVSDAAQAWASQVAQQHALAA